MKPIDRLQFIQHTAILVGRINQVTHAVRDHRVM